MVRIHSPRPILRNSDLSHHVAGDVMIARKLLPQACPTDTIAKQRLFVHGVDVAPKVVRAFADARAWLDPQHRDG